MLQMILRIILMKCQEDEATTAHPSLDFLKKGTISCGGVLPWLAPTSGRNEKELSHFLTAPDGNIGAPGADTRPDVK